MAQRAGLGFIGKNSLLIHPQQGSFIFLAEILTDLELKSSEPFTGVDCGGCRACLEHCPGNAILPGNQVDARRCVSYLTIEKKGPLAPWEALITGGRIFGCDHCQDCCPYNQKAIAQTPSPFACLERWQGLKAERVQGWSEADFAQLKINSPLKRAGLKALRRNASVPPFDGLA